MLDCLVEFRNYFRWKLKFCLGCFSFTPFVTLFSGFNAPTNVSPPRGRVAEMACELDIKIKLLPPEIGQKTCDTEVGQSGNSGRS